AMASTEVRAHRMAQTARPSTAGSGYWMLARRRGSGTWAKAAATLAGSTGHVEGRAVGAVHSMTVSLVGVAGGWSHHARHGDPSLSPPHSSRSPRVSIPPV